MATFTAYIHTNSSPTPVDATQRIPTTPLQTWKEHFLVFHLHIFSSSFFIILVFFLAHFIHTTHIRLLLHVDFLQCLIYIFLISIWFLFSSMRYVAFKV